MITDEKCVQAHGVLHVNMNFPVRSSSKSFVWPTSPPSLTSWHTGPLTLSKDKHTHDFHNNRKPLNHNLLFAIWYCERMSQDWTLQWSMACIANWVMLAGRWLHLANQPPEGLIKLHNGKKCSEVCKKEFSSASLTGIRGGSISFSKYTYKALTSAPCQG